jgi:hypothetical protein
MARRDSVNAILCAVGFVLVVLLLNPWVNTPFDDDFSYAFTVKRLLETGHLIYNGWSAPVLIPHVYWGAAWTLLFGFSFNVLRLSTLPLAAASLSACYLLARRAGLHIREAFFVTALIGLSPLFLPLALSFMTDVPAFLFMMVSLYALTRASPSRAGLTWLAFGVLVADIGGMGRQPVWIVPISVLPYLAAARRNDAKFVIAACLGWFATILIAAATLRWFASQPDVMADGSILRVLRSLIGSPFKLFIHWILKVSFALALFVLPTLAASVIAQISGLRKRRRSGFTAAFVAAGFSLLFLARPGLFPFPWLVNIVAPDGPVGNLELAGYNPQTLPTVIIYLFSAAAVGFVALSLIGLIERVRRFSALFEGAQRFFSPPDQDFVLPILFLFTVSYCALLVTRMTGVLLFDRYLLPIIPCAAIAAMRQFHHLPAKSIRRRLSIAFSLALLIVFSGYGLATTQSLIALQRARNHALNMLRAKGVSPTEIAAGFEYDMWTQLNSGGWFNHYGITNPTHPFEWDKGITFLLLPVYRIEHGLTPRTEPSEFPPINYTAWLPPFHRTIYIDRFKDPWWVNWKEGMPPPPKDWENVTIW